MGRVEELIRENYLRKTSTLDLSNLALTEIPRSVFDLTHLQELKLMNNRITNIPEEIGKLKRLTHLYLYNNKIKAIPSDVLRQMYFLRCLDLAENSVDYKEVSLIYEELDQNVHYHKFVETIERQDIDDDYFWFHGGTVNKVPPELFELVNLKHLRIYSTNIECIPKEIKYLKNLETLSFHSANISDIPDEIFQLNNLKEVIFDNNDFTEFPLGLLELPYLKSISFNNNNISFVKKIMDKVVIDNEFKYMSFGGNPLKDFNANVFNVGFDYIKESVYGITPTKA
ncbi:leucine-rich repeat protein [Muricauda oceani]|uniref:Leucine-rich repeat protein n=1 Tax=Flagellimonas oceani TaxID=2698672 RepID=A0A6G7IZE8_9FLAO|nr:leucine-rich repeat protein [Allomuricauda oceani]MBW8244761.1 leucine-rich repeat protein [Allomuricauda oceani]QII43694.1 leucine-rich repeat protein [Allomuricauda oceani]